MKLTLLTSLAFSASTIASELVQRGYLVGGGFGLRAGICPSGLNKYYCGTCCPSGFEPITTCSSTDTNTVCCPKGVTCTATLSATPFCADPSWVLWITTAVKGVHFCCLPGEIGTNNAECVGSGAVVAATLAASSLGQPTPTGAAAATVTSEAPLTASGPPSGTTSSTASGKSSGTKSSTAGSGVETKSAASSAASGNHSGNIFAAYSTFTALMGTVYFAARWR
ncbi:hypothetical protein GQ44DRAFT_408126 [Phaeosphaeriaceae sp. PMI808]|nr:hypothetical protein GQ44DRAFT_408126 [Phaeosphaeriaceae sp. PMI808]